MISNEFVKIYVATVLGLLLSVVTVPKAWDGIREVGGNLVGLLWRLQVRC